MAEEKLLVKRDGEFCYPIYFENDFSFLSQALTDEGLAGKSMCIVSDSTVFFLIQKNVRIKSNIFLIFLHILLAYIRIPLKIPL